MPASSRSSRIISNARWRHVPGQIRSSGGFEGQVRPERGCNVERKRLASLLGILGVHRTNEHYWPIMTQVKAGGREDEQFHRAKAGSQRRKIQREPVLALQSAECPNALAGGREQRLKLRQFEGASV